MLSPFHFGRPRFEFDTIDSTMIDAVRRAEAGAGEGTMVIAERQTAGRGRLGRSWVSEPGVGCTFRSSCARPLRPSVPPC